MGTKRRPPDESMHAIGDRLRTTREELNLTQEQIAEKLGISKTHYGQAERGRCCLSIEKLIHLNKLYGIDLTYLLTGKEPVKLVISNLFDDCPQEKVFDMEQLIRYASNLYRKK